MFSHHGVRSADGSGGLSCARATRFREAFPPRVRNLQAASVNAFRTPERAASNVLASLIRFHSVYVATLDRDSCSYPSKQASVVAKRLQRAYRRAPRDASEDSANRIGQSGRLSRLRFQGRLRYIATSVQSEWDAEAASNAEDDGRPTDSTGAHFLLLAN